MFGPTTIVPGGRKFLICGKFEYREILLRHVAIDSDLKDDERRFFDEDYLCSEFKRIHNIQQLGQKYNYICRIIRWKIHDITNAYIASVGCLDYVIHTDEDNHLHSKTIDGTIWAIGENQTHKDIIENTPKYKNFLPILKNFYPTFKEQILTFINSENLLKYC